MRYKLMKGKTVVWDIAADEPFTIMRTIDGVQDEYKYPAGSLALLSDTELDELNIIAYEPPPIVIPDPEPVVLGASRARIKIALFEAGLLSKITDVIETASVPAQIWYAEETFWSRNDAFLYEIMDLAQITPDQMDAAFQAAQ